MTPTPPTQTPRTDFALRDHDPLTALTKEATALELELIQAQQSLKKTQKHLRDSNRGAEINAHCANEAIKKRIVMEGLLEQAQRENQLLCEFINRECKMTGSDKRIEKLVSAHESRLQKTIPKRKGRG